MKTIFESVNKELLPGCLKVVDKKTGIVSECIEMMNECFDPKIYFYTTKMADTSKYEGFIKCHSNNGGAAFTRELAMLASIGESVERYCSSIYNYDDMIYSSYNSLTDDAVNPEEWALFSEKQYAYKSFKFARFDGDTKINWIKGFSLTENREKYVPAVFVYLPYIAEPHESIISPCVSTGLSAGTSLQDAILGGIYEVVERDAISIMWFNKLSMPVIDSFEGSRSIKKIYNDKISCDGANYELINITTDLGIPVIFSIKKFNSAKGISAACGAASRLDPEKAAIKAMIESAQGAKWIQYLHVQDWLWGYNDDFSDITDFQDHIHLYSMPEMVPGLGFVASSNIKQNICDIENLDTENLNQNIKKCVDLLGNAGHEVIVVNITSSDIQQTPFRVVKVLIPGLQQLNGDHNYPFLGGSRLYNVPKKLKYQKGVAGYNHAPHPFP